MLKDNQLIADATVRLNGWETRQAECERALDSGDGELKRYIAFSKDAQACAAAYHGKLGQARQVELTDVSAIAILVLIRQLMVKK